MNAPLTLAAIDRSRARTGLVFGLVAYAAWGVLPVYFKALDGVSPLLIVAHRIVWSLVLLMVLVSAVQGWPAIRGISRKSLVTLAVSATLIAVNWLLYVLSLIHI